MNQNDLAALREKILADIMPLATSQGTGADNFPLLLRIIQNGNATKEIYDKAYESASSIENAEDKLNALFSLLDEVDYDVDEQGQGEEVPGAAPAGPETTQPEQSVEENEAQPVPEQV